MQLPTKIVQLSDCHIPGDPGEPYRGIDAREALEQLKPMVAALKPELLLLTGDLSEDASEASYGWLASSLGELEIPVAAIPGNHDDPECMKSFFPFSAAGDALFVELDHWQLLLLDSTIRNEVPGRLEPTVLDQVEQRLRADDRPALIALHHQPVEVGSPWIDKYALLNPESFWSSIEGFGNVKGVTWGHIHQVFEQQRGGVSLFGSPSSVCNSYPGREKFEADPTGPAARWFELFPGGDFKTGIFNA